MVFGLLIKIILLIIFLLKNEIGMKPVKMLIKVGRLCGGFSWKGWLIKQRFRININGTLITTNTS